MNNVLKNIDINNVLNNTVKAVRRLLRSRSLKYGTNAFILVAAVVAIAVFINVLVGMVEVKWDLTPNKLYSITDTTKDILENLEKDVVIYGLFDDGKIGASTDYKQVVELLNHYEKYPRVKVEYVDPDRDPGIIKELDPDGVSELGKSDFVVKCGSKIKKLDYYDLFEFDQQALQSLQFYVTGSTAEQGFTGAIVYVTADKTPVVYFAEGHNEFDINTDLDSIKTFLDRNNYDVKSINLLTQPSVPDDAELLVVASPKSDFSADERDKVKEYLKNGGKAIFMFDFLPSDTEFTQIEDILKDYNVALNYDRVKENDAGRHFPNNQHAIILDAKRGQFIPEDFNIVLENSRSIRILKNVKEYITTNSILVTSDKAVGEQVDKSRGEDIKGPLDIGVAVEYKGGFKPAKLIVLGNAFFITDDAESRYGPYFNNGMRFFLYSLNWMLEKQDSVVIAPKTYYNPAISITAQQANIMGLAVVILLPVMILGTGLYVFLRRRHL